MEWLQNLKKLNVIADTVNIEWCLSSFSKLRHLKTILSIEIDI